MWYNNNYRRHLCDMHIDDWDDEFLSKFSPENYLENLKAANVQTAMLYFQSHVGLCYYPTKCGKMHNAFHGREDMMQKLAAMCRKSGIKVVGYYSLIYNNCAYHDHPEWRIVPSANEFGFGESASAANTKSFASNNIFRYALCCPNNPDYRKFVSLQMKEIAEYFEFDGMFFDMLFWPKMCRCKHCLAKFKAETGYDLPEEENWNDPIWLLHIQKRREWMGAFAQSVTDEMKSYVPEISVEHNTAFAVLPNGKNALAEEVLNACDYAGGDLYGGQYHQSFTCKFYKNITKNQPFEFMPARCEPNLSKHTVTKSEDTLLSETMLTAAHHGANLVIDAINPVGTLDTRFYERLGKVFTQEAKYEKYYTGDMIEDVGVYYTLRSKFNAHNEPYTNHNGCVNSVKLMIEKNISCGVIGGYGNIEKYKLLIAPCLTQEDEYDYNRIIEYVKNGGRLYISGGDCNGLVKEFFGAEISGRTEESVVYIAPKESNMTDVEKAFGWFNAEYPLHFDGTAPIACGMDEKYVIATLTLPYTPQNTVKFVSIHSNPPGVKTDIPAMAYRTYGEGKILWSALPIENVASPYQYGDVFINILQNILGFDQTYSSNAPENVEIVAFRNEGEITVSAVQYCNRGKANKIYPFEICVKTAQKPKKLLQLPTETEYTFKYENGIVKYTVDNLEIFDMKKLIL